MFRGGLVLFLCAWAALTLPWERCHADCHDRVVPVGGAHECHSGHRHEQHHGHDHGHDHGHQHESSDHDPVQFDGFVPSAVKVLSATAIVTLEAAAEIVPVPSAPLTTSAEARAGPPPGLRSTVLLL
ncbi:MAG: hypothetical protein ACYTGN_14620 [Planctomycetota bacterium]|jgi:hypothetical protein